MADWADATYLTENAPVLSWSTIDANMPGFAVKSILAALLDTILVLMTVPAVEL